MSVFSDALGYLRTLYSIPRQVRHPWTEASAIADVAHGLKNREQIFLDLVKETVFGNPRSPYLFLFREAGHSQEDVAFLVREKGLDEALEILSDSGVYVTFDEFKCRVPIERNGRVLEVSHTDFDDPTILWNYSTKPTSGSTGKPTSLKWDPPSASKGMSNLLFCHLINGVRGAPAARFSDATPSTRELLTLLDATIGQSNDRWFRTVPLSQLPGGLKFQLAVGGIRLVSRLSGFRLPRPQSATPLEVATWMAEQLKVHGRCLLQTGVSNAVRVAEAAIENGVNLTGAVIMGAGEPATAAKAKIVGKSGARWVVNYVLSEAGYVGFACLSSEDPTDVHLLKSRAAIIQRPYTIEMTGEVVGVFRLTNLSLFRPKIMINVELDDFGIIEDRECGCPLQDFGFKTHIRQIFSHSKLTGEGVTLVGGWMLPILEELLPSRFGGSPLDYQLVEDETASGQTRVTIAVSPRLGELEESEIVRCFLDGLSAQGRFLERAMWEAAGTLRVARREPFIAGRDKVLPLHRTRRALPD